MNVTESVAWQVVAAFVAGQTDPADEYQRQRIAHSLAVLDERASKALGAGTARDLEQWESWLAEVAT